MSPEAERYQALAVAIQAEAAAFTALALAGGERGERALLNYYRAREVTDHLAAYGSGRIDDAAREALKESKRARERAMKTKARK
jgi:hypothetical protein